MDKHGSSDWLGPLMEGLGPNIQIHIADFASLLEALYNFYHFRKPYATMSSLCLLDTLFCASAFGGTEFRMKIWWGMVGLTFFACFPISSRYPRYRHLVAPWKWMIWDVPTHSEWCFQYLQECAAEAKAAIVSATEDDSHHFRTGSALTDQDDSLNTHDADSFISAQSSSLNNERDILSFGCTYLHTLGRLVLSTTSIRFDSSLGKILPYAAFNKPFCDLIEMHKRQTHASILKPLAKITTGLDKLELSFQSDGAVDGTQEQDIVVLENMRGRDKAFNAIIGFSGMRWQSLQAKTEKRKIVTPGDAKVEWSC